MATHDYVIANNSGAAVRQDLNNALQAIVTNNSSDTEPANTFAHMLWLDTANDILKIRNAANDAWIDWITQAGIHLLPDGAVGTPSLTFASETDTGLYRIAANTLGIATSGTERVEISDTGIIINEGGAAAIDVRIEGDTETNLVFTDAGNDRVGIGEGAPDQRLHVTTSAVDVVKIESTSAGNGPNLTFRHSGASPADGDIIGKLTFEGTNDNASTEVIEFADIGVVSTDVSDGSEDSAITFSTRDAGTLAERARVDEDGRFLVGTATALETGNARSIQVVNTSEAVIALGRDDSSITAGNDLGSIKFFGNDGGTYQQCAEILAEADGTHANDDKPTRLVFSTTADGANSVTERMRIHEGGEVTFGTTSTDMTNATSGGGCVLSVGGGDFAAANQVVANFNRTDGDNASVITIRHDGDLEGTITVSGSTVSYNGGHLTRWSQLEGGAARTEILRGSVLSNLDEMCVWSHAATPEVLYTAEDELPEGVEVGDVKVAARAAYTEDNDQLNRLKVSDVEGDPNVAGVFQMWDNDDDTYTNDFYVAMTGDFVIRIAEGTTVARGDLLMSAGDGTAKPQDDDIVRSKTIAKVTSTVVSTTYADGSYCVPCVLMAC